MKRQFAVVFLMLGTACAGRAQDTASESAAASSNVAAEYSPAPAVGTTPFQPAASGAVSFAPNFAPNFAPQPVFASPLENAAPDASPSPAPDPKFIYGGRDDFRWQLAIGVDWLRFRSSIFNASAVGVSSSVTYFTNDWFGVEGNFTTGFAPQIFDREHVKLLLIGGGPKVAWRERKWEPWLHAIVGLAHEQPQTAGNGRNAFAVEVGGGADYRFNPRLSGRLEGDWVRTSFFSQSQNDFELMGGVVFHF
ncbi:MAG TPA: hypothetical protein VKH15_02830 [Candidatus Acidoferrum sp.]|nr:hypothetical protein [Candidatus Acidoferrum sp.]